MCKMLRNKFFTGFLILLALGISGCSSWRTGISRNVSDWSNRDATVTCYSGGKVIFEGESDGKVFSEPNSDGYILFDKKNNGKLTEVSGDCIIRYK